MQPKQYLIRLYKIINKKIYNMKKILLSTILTFIGFVAAATVTHISTPITLDASGTNTTTIIIEGKSINFSHWSFSASGFQIDGNNDFVGLIEGSGSWLLKKLNYGASIGVSENFVTPSGYAPAYHNNIFGGAPAGGLLADGESTYFGFKVTSGSNTYYAWLKLTRTNTNVVVIDEYAYENVSDKAISAGDTGSGSVGINEVGKVEFSIFPNPTSDFLQFNIDNDDQIGSLTIITLEGKTILEKTITTSNSIIDVRNLVNGVYIISIKSNGSQTSKVFVKN